MRESMGATVANDILRRAMTGEPGLFYSIENGKIFGTMDTTVTSVINWGKNGIPFRTDPDWMAEAIILANTLGVEFEREDMADPEEAREIAKQLRIILAGAKHG